MFTFKSSSVEEETPEKPEDGITDKEMEDLASILAEKILQVKQLPLQYLSILSVLFTFMFFETFSFCSKWDDINWQLSMNHI